MFRLGKKIFVEGPPPPGIARNCYGYAAGGMPLAFTQEDFLVPKINSIKFTRTVVNRASSIYICSICLFLSSFTVSNSQNWFKVYTTVPLYSPKMFENAPFHTKQWTNWNWNFCFMHRVLNTFYIIRFDSWHLGNFSLSISVRSDRCDCFLLLNIRDVNYLLKCTQSSKGSVILSNPYLYNLNCDNSFRLHIDYVRSNTFVRFAHPKNTQLGLLI